jgi:hypothetical protein
MGFVAEDADCQLVKSVLDMRPLGYRKADLFVEEDLLFTRIENGMLSHGKRSRR